MSEAIEGRLLAIESLLKGLRSDLDELRNRVGRLERGEHIPDNAVDRTRESDLVSAILREADRSNPERFAKSAAPVVPETGDTVLKVRLMYDPETKTYVRYLDRRVPDSIRSNLKDRDVCHCLDPLGRLGKFPIRPDGTIDFDNPVEIDTLDCSTRV